MRFNLIFLMNLAGIASIGSPSSVPFLPNFSGQLQKCPRFVDRLKKFSNCNATFPLNAKFTHDALPYICFLSLNIMKEMCSESDSHLWNRLEAQCRARGNATICPFDYASKTGSKEVNAVADYFRDEEKCKTVCDYSAQTADDCFFMEVLNEERKRMIRLSEGGEGIAKQTDPRESHLPIQQNAHPNGSKQMDYGLRRKSEDSHAPAFQTKGGGDFIINYDQTLGKIEVKTTVKTETTSECANKEKKEKAINSKFDEKSKSDISENNKGMDYSNILNNDTVETHIKEVSDLVHGDNKEVGANNGQVGVNTGKIDFTVAEMPSSKTVNDPMLVRPSSGKKDYTYSSTVKASGDESEDVDNNNNDNNDNGEIPENPQLQDELSAGEYELGKVPNPKELYNGDGLFQAEDSHFSAYFLMTISIIIVGYIIYHNKNKIVAYALEGRRGKNGRRRPTSASYRKLDCNLEEAIASNPSHASVTNVVY